MASEIRVNKLNSQTGVGTITLSPTGVDISGVTTVSTLRSNIGIFSGTITGEHHGDGSNLTGVASTENIRTNTNATFLQNINVSGTSTVAGTSTANLFSGSGASLTSLPAANLTGALPAISAASLTSVPAANIVGLATAGFNRSGGFGGRTVSSSISLNSTSHDVTGFSADVTRFDVIFRSASTASVDFGVRIGDSGGIETTNYRCRSGFNRSSDNVAEENSGGFFSHGLAGSYTTSGFMTFISLTNAQHRWQCFGRFTENATDSHVFTIDGYRHLDSALTQIRILPESGSFSGGEVHVVTYVD